MRDSAAEITGDRGFRPPPPEDGKATLPGVQPLLGGRSIQGQPRPRASGAWARLDAAAPAEQALDFGAFSRDATDACPPSSDPSPSSWAPAAIARARSSRPPGAPAAGAFGKATLRVVTPWIVRPLARPALARRAGRARGLVAAAVAVGVATATGLAWAAGLLPG